MDWKAIVRERLDVQTGDPALDAEIVDELAEHLAERFEDVRAGAVAEDVARRQVLAELHDSRTLASALEANRAHRRTPPPAAPPVAATPRPLADLGGDIRYACRLLARTPSFTAAAILLLALGIGGATAIFSVVDAVLVQPLPYVAAERLVAVWETDRKSGTVREPASVPDFLDLQARATHVESIGGVIAADVTLTPPRGQATRLAGMLVTQELLPMLGARPLAGRTFAADEHRAADGERIVISTRLARRLFGDSPAAIGQTLSLDDRVREIVGVMPDTADVGMIQWLLAADYSRGFADRDVRSRVDIWLPLSLDPARRPRQTHPLLVVARTRPGVSLAVAQTEISGIMAALERGYPENEGRGAHVEAFTDVVLGPVRPALLALLLAVGLVLLSVCVNVANLLLVRGTGRLREVAVRTALGASPVRLTRQFIVENAVLASAALGLGLLVAYASVRALVALAPPTVPRLADVALDGRVLLAALGIGATVAMVFGLVPVMQSRRLDVQRWLAADGRGSSGGRARGRMRAWLVGAQVALAVVLTVGAGLMVRTLWQVSRVDPGFRTTGVVKAEFQLPERRYPKDFRNWPRFVEVHRFNAMLLDEVGRMPGVEAAAIADNHPLDSGFGNSFVVVGREAEARDWPEISVRGVSPGYFHTLGVPVLQGRALEARDDTESAPVLLVNEAAAQRFFAGRDPLGQEIAFWGVTRRIVGVVGSERIRGVTEAAPPAVYVPIAQNPTRGPQVLLVRGSHVGALTTSVRQAVARVDPELAVFGLEPLADTLRETQGHRRFVAQLLLAFAGLALLLATIGVHAVLSYDVAQRRREIGIRLALGASPSGVSRTIVGRAMLLVVAGLAVGAMASIGLTRLIRGLLFEVAPGDAATLALVVAVFGVAALVASYVPARRAARIDPMAALRHE